MTAPKSPNVRSVDPAYVAVYRQALAAAITGLTSRANPQQLHDGNGHAADLAWDIARAAHELAIAVALTSTGALDK